MSHEILLICGTDTHDARDRRRRLVRHAVERVPATWTSEVIDTPTAVAALVETVPAGGTFAEVSKEDDESVRITVATTRAGLEVTAGAGHLVGAEAGHATLRVRPGGSVQIGTDGIASIPSFWAEHEGELLFSTHLASLVSLGLPGTEDGQGVLEYLVMLHPLQDRTTLKGAHLLPPGGCIEWVPDTSTRHTARPLFVPSPDARSDGEAIEAFAEIWWEVIGGVIERTSRERPALGLSGGLDSRAIAVAAADQGFRPSSYTYGSTRNRESRTAAQVARRLGLPHLHIPVTDDRMLRDAAEITKLLDGAHSPTEMFELWFGDVLRSFTDVVINGLAGGPLWGDDKAVGLTDPDDVAARQWQRYAPSVAAIGPFLTPDMRAQAGVDISRGIRESMAPWDFGQRADMAIFWKLSNRQLRWGNMLFNGFRRAGIRLEAPFLDGRLLRFAAALSPSQRLNGSLYLRAHRDLFTATSGVGRSDDGNSPRGLSHVYWSGESSLLHQLTRLTLSHPVSGVRRATRYATHRAASKLREATHLSGPADLLDVRADVFPADLWARTSRTYSERLAALLETAPAHSLLSQEAIEQAARNLRGGRPTSPALTLGKVATANLWLADYAARQDGVRAISRR